MRIGCLGSACELAGGRPAREKADCGTEQREVKGGFYRALTRRLTTTLCRLPSNAPPGTGRPMRLATAFTVAAQPVEAGDATRVLGRAGCCKRRRHSSTCATSASALTVEESLDSLHLRSSASRSDHDRHMQYNIRSSICLT